MLLARMLGCTLAELGARMTAEEYGYWMALHRHDPLDGGWFQTGVIASVLANIHRDRSSKPYSAADFIPQPWKQEEQPDEMDPAEFVRLYG